LVYPGPEKVALDPDPESDAKARVGQVLRDKYRLERVLGVGGMAAVYAASHRNGRRVAIKILHRELSVNGEIRERFLREGQAANAVGHPGAVAVLDDDVSEDGAAFLVMELLDGGTAEEFADSRGGKLPLSAVCSIGAQLLEVLESAHQAGIVHRDIKPANLFITRHGRVKVLDFGIARLRQGTGARATQTGLTLGTPAFMAPEQALGRVQEVDARTDVWAIGATLFSLVSGRSVHEAPTAQETLIYAATQRAPTVQSVVPDVPKEIADTLDRALSFERENRWPTAAAMREAWTAASRAVLAGKADSDTLSLALQGFQPRASDAPMSSAHDLGTQLTGTAAVSAPLGQAPPPTNPRRVALFAAIGLGVFVVIATVWALGSRSGADVVTEQNADSSAAASGAAPPPVAVSVTAPPPVTVTPAPTVVPEPAPRAGEPRPRVSRPSVPKPARSAAPRETATPKPPAQNTDCTPPYTLNSQGMKIWKRGCL